MRSIVNLRSLCWKHLVRRCVLPKLIPAQCQSLHLPHQHRKSSVYSSKESRKQVPCIHHKEQLVTKVRCSVFHVQNNPQIEPISVMELSKTESVLKQVRTEIDQRDITCVELVRYVEEITQACYSDLSNLPWLHSYNTGISFLQLVANDKVDSLLGPVVDHEVTERVLHMLRQEVDQVPDEDCPNLLMNLICLGVDETDLLVSRLLAKLEDSVHEMNINQLGKVAEILKISHVRNFQLAMLVIHRVQELDFDETNRGFIENFCFLSLTLLDFMSKDLLEKLSDRFLEHIQTMKTLSCPSDIAACLNYCRKVHFSVGLKGKENALKIAAIAIQSIPRIYNEIEPRHIAKYCHNLKKMHLYTGPLVDKLREVSLEKLSDPGLCVRDVVDSSFAFSRDCPEHVRKTIASLVLNSMDEADVVTLSYLCEAMLDLHIFEPPLVEAVQSKTLELFNLLQGNMTFLSKVLFLLSKTPRDDPELRDELVQRLNGLMNGIQGLDPRSLCKISIYMLPNIRHTIPTVLMDRLVAVIPQCNLKLMSNILDGLNLMQKPWLRELHNQVLDLRICIQTNISQKIGSVTDIEVFIKLLKSAYLHADKKDTAVLEMIMSNMPRVTKALTSVQFNLLIILLKRLNYHHPEVFEDLVNHMVQNCSQDFQSSLNLIGLLSKTGYLPKDFESFRKICTNMLETLLQDDAEKALCLAFDLSLLQIFPESSLRQMFSMEFLERIDVHLECNPEMRDFLEGLMMKLNRSVVLECPQLDVPWFHEEFCLNKVQSKPKSDDFFELDVEQILCDELGGKSFFKTGVFSPYYYYINFMLLLDPDNQIVTLSSCSNEDIMVSNFQRVAVLLQHEVNFCTRSFQLKSYHLSKIRHLEILGFKVVPVPLYEWTSMALTETSERANYLREKICS